MHCNLFFKASCTVFLLLQPLFLYLAHQAVHAGNGPDPVQVPQKYVDRFTNKIHDVRRRIFAGWWVPGVKKKSAQKERDFWWHLLLKTCLDRESCKACGHFMSGYVVALCSRLLVVLCRGMWLLHVQGFWSFYGVFYVQGMFFFYV